jgi:hypothetical protein
MHNLKFQNIIYDISSNKSLQRAALKRQTIQKQNSGERKERKSNSVKLLKIDMFWSLSHLMLWTLSQRILKGEASLYPWPPVWLVWNQLYDNWQFLFVFAKQANPNQSKRRSMVQWYFPFSITCLSIKFVYLLRGALYQK